MTGTREITKRSKNWRSYKPATSEPERLPQLLKLLCESIEVQEDASTARRIALARREALFGAVMSIYSGRRAETDLKVCVERGYLSRVCGYRTRLRVLKDSATTATLTRLIEESAGPLSELETVTGQFAAGSMMDNRWCDLKLNFMIGAATRVVTSAQVSPPSSGYRFLPELVAATALRFQVKEVSADAAYLSVRNLEAIDQVGAVPLIPLRANAILTPKSALWRRLVVAASLDEGFRRRLLRRSRVEATFAAMKALGAGGPLRSKDVVVRANAMLVVVLLHNLTCLCRAIEELGRTADFGLEPTTTQL